jgi:isopentenyl diphosphate isomerase/L-lactate dehydrogenase-like FMN-dependent dehydrogenase
MLTTTKPGDVARVNPTGVKILQLYFLKNAEYTLKVIRLAETLGFHAFAITVDTQIFGKRRKDERTVFQPKVALELFNELGYEFKMRDVNNKERSFVHQIKNDLTWEDIRWIRRNTALKIILKGVISPNDVAMAHDCGVDALWVSNHGGRQLDTCPATILALPGIRSMVNRTASPTQKSAPKWRCTSTAA